MKKYILLCAALVAAASLRAQDMIVLRNASAEEIPAKVLEVGENQIRYRKFSNPDGPVYTVAKSEVFFIRYENGEKEVVNTYDTPAAPAVPGTGQIGSGTAQASRYAAKRKPLRDKLWEIGISPHWGMSAVFFEYDSWAGIGIGADVSGNYYFNRYASGCVGASLGFTYHLLMPDSDEDIGLTTMDLDLYFGEMGSSSGSAFGGKAGFALNFPLSCKMGDYDMSEMLNGASFGIFSQLGWTWKHSDFGVRLQYNFTNTFKEIDSSMFRLGLYYGYRF